MRVMYFFLGGFFTLSSAACWSGLPALDASGTWACQGQDDCLDGYFCVEGFCSKSPASPGGDWAGGDTAGGDTVQGDSFQGGDAYQPGGDSSACPAQTSMCYFSGECSEGCFSFPYATPPMEPIVCGSWPCACIDNYSVSGVSFSSPGPLCLFTCDVSLNPCSEWMPGGRCVPARLGGSVTGDADIGVCVGGGDADVP